MSKKELFLTVAEEDETSLEELKFPPLLTIPSLPVIGAGLLFITVALVALYVPEVTDWINDNLHVSRHDLIQYGSIPVISIGFTYCHIWLALWMMFYPIEYFGIKCLQYPKSWPYGASQLGNIGFPGWQGIVPFRAEEMALHALELMTTQLINVEDVFCRLKPDEVAEKLFEALSAGSHLEEIVSSVATSHTPQVWGLIIPGARKEILDLAMEQAPATIAKIVVEMQKDVEKVFSIEHLVMSIFTGNPNMLNDMFIKCGCNELKFLRNSGAFWGGFFGLLQMGLWIIPACRIPGLVFPAFGFIVGAFTNYLSLKMIFEPIDPINVCGIKVQGIFLQRQKQVSAVFAKMIEENVLSAQNITREMLDGPQNTKLREIIRQQVCEATDQLSGPCLELVKLTVGHDLYNDISNAVAARLIQDIVPICMGEIEEYTRGAFNIEATMRERMAALPSKNFEGLLHPVFAKDEWKLILMGGALGVVIGLVQAYGINS